MKIKALFFRDKLKKNINPNKTTLIFIIVYFVIIGMYCGIDGTKLRGEWDDYIFPAVTILEKQQISVYEEDIPLIKKYFPEWGSYIDEVGITSLSGRTTREGGTLAWYFPVYAVFCIPMIVFLRFLNLPTTYAIIFTNFGIVVIALLVIYNYLKKNEKIKFILIILLSIHPVVFYYSWVTAEAVIYALLIIGLVFWYNKWYKRAAFFVSVAGMVNTTIMSIGIIMIIEYLINLLETKERESSWIEFIGENILDLIKYASCYLVGLVPMFYFFYHTGYINLTASYPSFLDSKDSIWKRFLAYLFDLNFGFLPYFPIILSIAFILLIVAIIRKHIRYTEWFLAFVINVYLYSIMAHINSGMSGIARYNVWASVILIFSVCLFVEELIKSNVVRNLTKFSLLVNMSIILLMLYFHGVTIAYNLSYKYWTPIARFFLDKYPNVYNPLHSTFNSRVTHQDGGYIYDTPIVYIAEDGYVRKILASSKDKEKLKKITLSEYSDKWLNEQIESLKDMESYISTPLDKKVVNFEIYELGERLSFIGCNNSAEKYFLKGLSTPEVWGTWTIDEEVRMRFQTTSEAEILTGCIECGVFNDSERYVVLVNDEKVYEGTATGENIEFDFINPGSGKLIEIKIILPDVVSPLELGLSNDTRKLGLGLRNMFILEKK